jgi:hypothetical protein
MDLLSKKPYVHDELRHIQEPFLAGRFQPGIVVCLLRATVS